MSCVTVTVVITFPINYMVVCSNLTHIKALVNLERKYDEFDVILMNLMSAM